MTRSEILIILLAEVCMILGAFAAIVTILLRRARRNIDALRAALKLRKKTGESIEYDRLIAQELQRTKLRMQTLLSRDKLDDEAIIATRLRASFLAAEQHARSYRENQELFWQALENALKDMIALSRLKIKQTAGSEREVWEQKLASSEQQVNELALLRGTFSAPADAMRQAKEQIAELMELRELKEQHIARIEKLVLDIAQLRSASSQAELPAELAAPPSAPASAVSASPVIIRHVQEVQYVQSAIADTLRQIDAYQANSSTEVKLLKDMCMEQRTLIKKLRERLKQGPETGDGEQGQEADVHAEALQRLLRDAEMCVQTLEQEIENLQTEINALRDQLRSSVENLAQIADIPSGGANDKQIEARLEQFREQNQRLRERILEHERQHQLSQQLRGFVASSFDCATPNAIIELLVKAMNQLSVHGNIQIKSGGKTLSAGFGGGVDSKDANLLNSIMVSQSVTAVGDDTILALPPLKMLIKSDGNAKSAAVGMSSLRELAEVCARQLAILEQDEQRRGHQSGRSQTLGSVKKSLANIKVQWGYQETEARQVTRNLVEDLTIALSTTDITEKEEKRLMAIIDESTKRLDVLFNSGKVVEKSIVQLLHKMDEAVL